MSNIRELMRKNLDSGVVDLTIDKWSTFNEVVTEMLDYPHYVWRGQRSSKWLLEPTLNRNIKDNHGKAEEIVKKHLDNFQYATRGRRGSNPKLNMTEDEWWALGQHHGLATPLLDWSTSPFVAAYFAFSEEDIEEDDYRAIYALHRDQVSKKSEKLNKQETTTDSLIEFIKPLSDDNPRLVNQSGLFSKGPIGQDLEGWIKSNFNQDNKIAILIKLKIPNSERLLALKALNRMNINHLSLFPDIVGSSVYSNMALKISKYIE